MRLPDRKFAAHFMPLGLVAALAGCGGSHPADGLALTPAVNGPAADYPITIGPAYEVNGVAYTPADVWNYDEVGYAALDPQGGGTISAAHHTLPLPSYVEVTSLDTGKTILVRLERRGPMDGNALIALSPGAADQLGAAANTPVRVRRVNPPEPERAALRAGERASERMETPMSLVNVLKRKLPGGEGANQPASLSASPPPPLQAPLPTSHAPEPAAAQAAAEAPPAPAAAQTSPLAETPKPAERPKATPARGHFVVQAGAFSQKANADRVAGRIGGEVSQSGSLYLVRTGPFGSRAEAEASLAKVKAKGYSDARIYKGG